MYYSKEKRNGMLLLLAGVWILEGIGKKIDERRRRLYLCEEYVNCAKQLEIVGWNFWGKGLNIEEEVP